jgi:aminoglycoside/choline kinase family phosphotransferase
VAAQPFTGRLTREIARIVKEVLTAEYYLNATGIALGRILALDGRSLTNAMRGQLETALRPLIQPLLDAPKTFIHFEYTPGNLQYVDGKVIALDFEQATMGPAAYDLATLLYAPEANLTPEQVADLAEYYHDQLPAAMPAALVAPSATLDAAAAVKMLVYAGAAANFYRKYDESERLSAMDWYLTAAERILARNPDCGDLAQMVHGCWRGQTHLLV